MVRCRIRDKKICAVDFLPARGDKNVEPRMLSVEEGRDIVELIKARSADFGTRFVEAGDCLRVIPQAVQAEVSKAA